jgi:glyoxylase-like metal-dependent hydrolase (beta-lactamase superfamily II)
MYEIAPSVHVIPALRGHALNLYLVGDVLVDAGTPLHARMIFRAVGDRPVRAHAITHCHPDHQGSSAAVCKRYGVPLWVGAGDADAVESGDVIAANFPALPLAGLWDRLISGAAHPVERRLEQGDEIAAGFVVIETPGHTPGHVSLWRAADRVLISGDVVLGLNPRTGRAGIHEHLDFTCTDAAQNRASLEGVATLEPDIVCFGHGAPVTGAAERLHALVA